MSHFKYQKLKKKVIISKLLLVKNMFNIFYNIFTRPTVYLLSFYFSSYDKNKTILKQTI